MKQNKNIFKTKDLPLIIPGIKIPRLNYFISQGLFTPFDESEGRGTQRLYSKSDIYLIAVLNLLTETGMDISRMPVLKKSQDTLKEGLAMPAPDNYLIITPDIILFRNKEVAGSVAVREGGKNPRLIIPVGEIVEEIDKRIERLEQKAGKRKK
jgi:DNA-binding transcriptional MerR regulator